MSKIRVLYHGSCFDGFCAAWVVWNHLTSENIDFIPVQYHQPPPDDLEDAIVYILDFSYKRQVMHEICDRAEHVICLDHHGTAEIELEGLVDSRLHLKFDMSKSGARLTWEHFQKEIEPPWQVLYTEDRDLWKLELEDSRVINDGLRTFPFDFDVWQTLTMLQAHDAGVVLTRYLKMIVEGAKKHSVPTKIPGHEHLVPIVNCTMRDVISDLGGQLAEEGGVGGTYFVKANGMYQYSLRSRGDVDVSKIASALGGGGHPKAAGFESSVLL